MVTDIVRQQTIKMIVVGKFDRNSLLTTEGFDVYDTKSNIDFDNRAKYIAVDAESP